MTKMIFAISMLLLLSKNIYADGALDTLIHHQYESPRSLGMGDASVAATNDYSMLFYNPAALARVSEGQINGAIDLSASTSFVTFYDGLQKAGKVNDGG